MLPSIDFEMLRSSSWALKVITSKAYFIMLACWLVALGCQVRVRTTGGIDNVVADVDSWSFPSSTNWFSLLSKAVHCSGGSR